MKIVLIGYGKMGQMIAQMASARGHEIIAILDSAKASATEADKIELLKNGDVAIEFTRPDAVIGNIELCLKAGIPLVTGTTGWMNQLGEVSQWVKEKNGSLVYASNFSIGVNLFMKMVDHCNQIMMEYPEYLLSMKEWHHQQKLDAPSGTALSIGEVIQKKRHFPEGIQLNEEEKASKHYLAIEAIREGSITGTHQVRFQSETDEITLRHTAFNRSGFAGGALYAAEWIQGKKGLYNFSEILP
jgi:4-hydroxy-tetrahydrodipicolinate reductase